MTRLFALLTLLATPLLATPLLATPLSAQEAPVVPQFVRAAGSGLIHSFTGDWEFMVGGGVAVFDCDGNALPDMLLAGGTAPATHWRNESLAGGDLRFAPVEGGAAYDRVSGAYPLDVDGDANTDLILLRVGENIALRGLGDCRFERANEAWGFDGGDGWSTALAATWEAGADWPTIAIGNYIDRREDAFPWGSCTDNWLHRPAGRGFAPPLALSPSHCALSMLFTDWDRSGQPALRVSNDREYYKGGQEQLWHMPPGEAPRLFTEAEGWARLVIWGMGIAGQDLDGDGFPEYFLTSMADNKLQTLASPGEGRPVYADVALARGVVAQRPYSGDEIRPSTAWHAQFEDVNNDGRADLFIAKGNVTEMPDFALRDPNNLLLGRADGTFDEAGDRAGVASMLTARGAALADFNRDGQVDLVVVNRNGPAELWRNAGPVSGGFVSVTPEQPGPNRNAVNAWVELRADGRVQRREVTVGGGHAGGVLGPQHFGLGTAGAAEVRVIWPDGVASDWQAVAAGGAYRLSRGAAPDRMD